MTARMNPEPVALTDGRWVMDPKRRIQVWVPEQRAKTASDDPIACRCGATIYQTCRSKSGWRTSDHKGRKPRVCMCGASLPAPNRRLCDDCTNWKRVAA